MAGPAPEPQVEEEETKELLLLLLPLAYLPFPWWKQWMPKVLIVEFCALRREVYCHIWLLALCSSSPFFN